MGFKDELKELTDRAHELAGKADKLDNKNLRDIFLLGIARFEQAATHPDIDRVDMDDDQRNMPFRDSAPLNSGGNAMFAAGDPGSVLQNQEAVRRANWPEPGTFDPAAKSPVPAGQQFNAAGEPFPGADMSKAPFVDPAVGTAENPAPGGPLDPAAVKPWDPNADKSMDPNAYNPELRSDNPGTSHSDQLNSDNSKNNQPG